MTTRRLFLLEFNRRTRAVTVREVGPEEAESALLEAEARARLDVDRQVVLLSAEDEEELRRTHARYFESFDELLPASG